MPITLNEEQKEAICSILGDYVNEFLDSPFGICKQYPSLREFVEYVGYITKEDAKAYEQLQKAKKHLYDKYGEEEW